jgi:hypothetical protein
MQWRDLRSSCAGRSWMIVGMQLLSILYRLVRCLLDLSMVLVRRDLGKDAELLVLRHENAILRRQIARVRYTPAERVWLAALSRLLPPRRWAEVFPVTPATILAWHRRLVVRKGDDTARRRPGHPPDHGGDHETCDAHGNREPYRGPPARAGRTGPARPSHRRLHRVARTPPRRRHRPRTSAVRFELETVPHHPSQGCPGRGLRACGYGGAQADLRTDRSRAWFSPGASGRDERAVDRRVDHPSRPATC